jgi:hypothetical protein
VAPPKPQQAVASLPLSASTASEVPAPNPPEPPQHAEALVSQKFPAPLWQPPASAPHVLSQASAPQAYGKQSFDPVEAQAPLPLQNVGVVSTSFEHPVTPEPQAVPVPG